MFHKDSEDEARFRTEVRDWVEANLPHSLRHRVLRPNMDELRPWHRLLYRRGWVAPHWPKEYGGMGASVREQVILAEELAKAGAPQLSPLGLTFLASALMAFGTEAQKEAYLPGILSGDTVWVQGYSEPNSGSDLASLITRAVPDGDDFVVNGQKIWTTRAVWADRIFALVRTDPDAKPKQAGISFLLIDAKSPGVTIRGIQSIAGDDELATVFFDDVRVPQANLVGPLNGGWKVANHVLGFERITSADPYRCFALLERVKNVARSAGALNDAAFRDRLVKVEIDVLCHAAIFNHAIESIAAGKVLGPESSIIMLVGTETLQALSDLLLEAAGEEAASTQPFETSEGPVEVATTFLFNRHATIYGGTNEIQRNVIATRVLGLPR